MPVKSQRGTEREKNPDDMSGSGTSARRTAPCAAYDEFPWFGLHGTDSSALRARLGLPEFPHLLAQGLLDGSLDDGLSCLEGNRFDGVEVEVQVRSLVAKGAARTTFPQSSARERISR